jgi:enterochelin esterase-like enzyme
MSKWAFRNTLTSDKQLKPVVDAWLKEYKIKKVVIIYDAEDAVSRAKVLPCCRSSSRTMASKFSTA